MSGAAPVPAFELGINYWPRRTAMYMWRELDLGAIREELAHCRDLGFDVVRFFCLTEDFLPGPETVSAARIADLVAVASAARDVGLRSMPTLITLNMSGKIWWPAWLRGRDLYGDPATLRAQARLVTACASALAGDRSVRALDLSNELDDAQRPATRDAGWQWTALLAAAARRAAPGTPILLGNHLASLEAENNVRMDDVAPHVDGDCMHAYPLYTAVARDFLDPELVPFSCALTRDLCGTGRPVLMQEFGLCTAGPGEPGRTIVDDFLGRPRPQYLASEEEGARYYADVLERLVATGASGAYPWCYADYDARLHEREPFATAVRERTFGLVRADLGEKPAAAVIREFARRRARGELVAGVAPRVLDVDADTYYSDVATHFPRLYRRWLAARGVA